MSNRWSASSIYVPCASQRYVMCALAVIGTMTSWMVYFSGYRTCKEEITQPFEQEVLPNRFVKNRCFISPFLGNMESKQFLKVYWSLSLQQSADNIFWVSYAVSSIVSGVVADMVGPRHVWGLGSLLAAVVSFILPRMAIVSPYAAFVVLVLCGIGFGVTSPCSSVLVAHWAPENERTIFVAFIESATTLGIIFVLVLHEQISEWGESWESWLYVSCVLNLVWILVWCTLFYNRPAEHPHIPLQQLQYLETTTASVQPYARMRDRNTPIVPWKAILLSSPFLALQLLNLATSWIQSILFYQMNTYMLNVFNEESMVIPGPYMTSMVLGIIFTSLLVHGWISDKLISKGLTSRTVNRRLFLLFSNYISAILVMAIPLLGCNTNWVLMVFFLLAHIQASGDASRCANVVDLSPRYAGLLLGVLTAGRVLANIFCRYFVNFMVEDLSDLNSWKGLFYISSAMLIILSSPYLCFGSGDVQEWNHLPKRRTFKNELVQSTVDSPKNSEQILEENTAESSKTSPLSRLFGK